MRRLYYEDTQTPTTSSLRHHNCTALNDDVTETTNCFSFSDASRSGF